MDKYRNCKNFNNDSLFRLMILHDIKNAASKTAMMYEMTQERSKRNRMRILEQERKRKKDRESR